MSSSLNIKSIHFTLLLITYPILFIASRNILQAQSAHNYTIEYAILADSKITVAGTTNINEFACFSIEKYGKSKGTTTIDPVTNTAIFRDTKLKVATVSLNCGNEAMNSNLYNLLRAEELPYIIIEIQQAKSKDGNPVNFSVQSPMTAKVYITLAGVRRTNEVTFTGKEMYPGAYHFTGQHNISLNDYHLKAPEALFGLVKVNDIITVKFDLKVAVRATPLP
jgi:hypothetical protein